MTGPIIQSLVPHVERFIEPGDLVYGTNIEGYEVGVEFRSYSSMPVSTIEADWHTNAHTVAEYWEDDSVVSRDDHTVNVEYMDSTYTFPATKVRLRSLTDIGGVGSPEAEVLEEAGYENIVDLMMTPHYELAEVEGIGQALAARIKADAGDVSHLHLSETAYYRSKSRQPQPSDTPSNNCPVRNCPTGIQEDSLYDHMIEEHGWYSADLEQEVDIDG